MSELSTESYKLLVFIPIIIMVFLRTGGISFFFRVFMRTFKLSYDDYKLKKTESKTYDLQLFKALEGINVKNINDAKFIKKQINNGRLKQQDFLFTHPIGYIGNERKSIAFFIKNICTIGICLALALYFIDMSLDYKLGYYRVEAMGQSEYVSLTNITTKKEDKFIGKNTCNFVLSHEFNFSIRKASCSLFMNAQEEDKLWLSKEIEKSDREYRVFYWGGVFYTFLFSYLSIGLRNFYSTNKLILELKEERRRAIP